MATISCAVMFYVLTGLAILVSAAVAEWYKGNDIKIEDFFTGSPMLVMWPIVVYYVAIDMIKARLARVANGRENIGNIVVVKGRKSKRVERILRNG